MLPVSFTQIFKTLSLCKSVGLPAQVGCMRQVLRACALGRPRGMGWRGRRERGSGWGTHVNPWLIHVNVWQKPLQYCKVINLQLKKNKWGENKRMWGYHRECSLALAPLIRSGITGEEYKDPLQTLQWNAHDPGTLKCNTKREAGVKGSWRTWRTRILGSKKSSETAAWTLNMACCSKDKETLGLRLVHSLFFSKHEESSWGQAVWWWSSLICAGLSG